MPDLFPTTEEAEKEKIAEIGIVNHLGPDLVQAGRPAPLL